MNREGRMSQNGQMESNVNESKSVDRMRRLLPDARCRVSANWAWSRETVTYDWMDWHGPFFHCEGMATNVAWQGKD